MQYFNSDEYMTELTRNTMILAAMDSPGVTSVEAKALFIQSVMTGAQSIAATEDGGMGLLGLIISEEEYLTIAEGPYVEIMRPGALLAGANAQALKVHEIQSKIYQAHATAAATMRSSLINAVPKDSNLLAALIAQHPIRGAYGATLRELYAACLTYFVEASPEDLKTISSRAFAPWDGVSQTLPTKFDLIRHCVKLHKDNGREINVKDILTGTIRAIQAADHTGFAGDVSEFMRRPAGEKTFDELFISMNRGWECIRELRDTEGPAAKRANGPFGSVNAAQAVFSQTDLDAAVQLAVTKAMAGIKMQGNDDRKGPAPSGGGGPSKQILFEQYCYTHGPKSSHSSAECKTQGHKRRKGHDAIGIVKGVTAETAAQHGGQTETYRIRK